LGIIASENARFIAHNLKAAVEIYTTTDNTHYMDEYQLAMTQKRVIQSVVDEIKHAFS
jgi:hypothetical protein